MESNPPWRTGWGWATGRGWAMGLLALGGGGLLLGLAPPAQAELLYRLDTRCSLQGAAPVACTVDAIEAGEVF